MLVSRAHQHIGRVRQTDQHWKYQQLFIADRVSHLAAGAQTDTAGQRIGRDGFGRPGPPHANRHRHPLDQWRGLVAEDNQGILQFMPWTNHFRANQDRATFGLQLYLQIGQHRCVEVIDLAHTRQDGFVSVSMVFVLYRLKIPCSKQAKNIQFSFYKSMIKKISIPCGTKKSWHGIEQYS